jgi:hypothetical protein
MSRYTATLTAKEDEGTVEVDVEDTGEGTMKSGHAALYYQGEEVPGEVPELIETQRFIHLGWEDEEDDEEGVPNVADGTTFTYDVDQELIEGSGTWKWFFGAEDSPMITVKAEKARSVPDDASEAEPHPRPEVQDQPTPGTDREQRAQEIAADKKRQREQAEDEREQDAADIILEALNDFFGWD